MAKEFKSFRDLKRPSPDGDDAPAAPPDGGWTLESDSGHRGTDVPEGARGRIDARPDGFGPMESGPPPYRDLESDEMRLLASFRDYVATRVARAELAD